MILELDGSAWDGPLVLGSKRLAARIRSALDPARARSYADGVREAEASWIHDFDDAQFSLGRAWYTHLEQDKSNEYFAGARESDALVEKHCPGLQDAMRALAAKVVGAPVVRRAGWCGPGVHVFPAHGLVAERGGEIHFDTEGLSPAQAGEGVAAYTVVLMLDPPASGGGLRVWDVRYRGSDAYEDEDVARPSVIVPYDAGDLVVIDSYRLHQIQPFGGERARISATCHAAFAAGQWETWF